jgi:hypothetical protein
MEVKVLKVLWGEEAWLTMWMGLFNPCASTSPCWRWKFLSHGFLRMRHAEGKHNKLHLWMLCPGLHPNPFSLLPTTIAAAHPTPSPVCHVPAPPHHHSPRHTGVFRCPAFLSLCMGVRGWIHGHLSSLLFALLDTITVVMSLFFAYSFSFLLSPFPGE